MRWIVNTLPGLGIGGLGQCWPSCPWGMSSPFERKLGKSVSVGWSDSVWLGPRGPLGRVWGSQAHPIIAKPGSQGSVGRTERHSANI